MRRLTPQKLLNYCLIMVFLCLVLPLYAVKGITDSMDHAQGTGTVGGIDFKAYYIAADMLRQGKDFYDVEQQSREVLARGLPLNESFYIYPPLLAILFVPLTILPMNTAAQVWFFLNVTLYGASLLVLCKAVDLGRRSRNLPLLWTLAFLFPPALYTIYKGQVNILLLLLLALTCWLYTKGSQRLAGAALGVAIMVKIVPILLLPYFAWRRQYTLCLATVVTISLIGVLGLMVVGIDPHLTYISSVLPSLAQPRPNPSNQSLGGFFSLLFIENAYTDNLVSNLALWKTLTASFTVGAILGVVMLCSRQQVRPQREKLELGLLITTMPLVANIAWVDMLVILVLPYAILFAHISERRSDSAQLLDRVGINLAPRWKKAVLASTVASAVLVSSPRFLDTITGLGGLQSTFLRNPLLISLPFYGLLILWLTYALIMIREGASNEANHA
jgi:hypothetical protein